jgi:DNA-directed RNA polymerase subunit RPC12/RpoP
MDSFPPPNFVKTDSAIDGIEVYLPAPPEPEERKEVVDFKCPQCGADTAYSVAEGGLVCTYCGYYEPPKKEVVGKGAQEFEFKVETLERAANGWGEARKELVCQNCGARISLPPGALTASCPYCTSNKVIQREAPQDVLRPRFLVPFKVEKQNCQRIARQWLGSSWMTPKSLQNVARITEFAPVYMPFWTFDSVANADWKAEVGHTRTERYYDASSKSWKTRTRIVWRWESGRVRLPFDDLVVPGTARVSGLLLGRINNFNLSDLVSYDPEFLAGMQAQAYDIPLEDAWDRGRRQMREATREACVQQASTSRIRNFSMNLDFSDESWRYILLPVYISAYAYQNKVYQVMVNGQSGAISGQRPVDWNKVWLVIAGLLAPGLIIGLIGLITLLFGGVGVILGGLGFILLVIGLVFAVIIFRQAQGLDDA